MVSQMTMVENDGDNDNEDHNTEEATNDDESQNSASEWQSGESDVAFLARVLRSLQESKDMEIEDDDQGRRQEQAAGDHIQSVSEEEEVDSDDEYERRPDDLEDLPQENVPGYPQENAAYFAKKKYVRKDKYKLATIVGMLDKQDAIGKERYNLPTILEMFKVK